MDTKSNPDLDLDRTDRPVRDGISVIRRAVDRYLQSNIDHESIRRTSGWTLLLVLLVTTILGTVLNMYQAPIVDSMRPIIDSTGMLIHPTLLIYLPVIVLVIGVIIMWYGSLRPSDFGIVRSELPLGVAILVVSWLLMQLVGAYAASLNGSPLELPAVWTSYGARYVFGDFFGQLFANAPFEEIVFRGVLLVQSVKLLRARVPAIPDRLSFAVALLLTQALFALYHIPSRLMAGVPVDRLLPAIILPFIVGVLLALVYYRTGNIFVPIVLHTFLNAPIMVVGSGTVGMETVFLFTIALVVAWPFLERGFDRMAARTGVTV